MSQIEYRLHWARTYLKGIGAISNSSRGVWAITDKGETITRGQVDAEANHWRIEIQLRAKQKRTQEVLSEGSEGEESQPWKDALIARLLELPPAGFERLAQRVLREAGFINVTLTGKSGDGGIDGVRT